MHSRCLPWPPDNTSSLQMSVQESKKKNPYQNMKYKEKNNNLEQHYLYYIPGTQKFRSARIKVT